MSTSIEKALLNKARPYMLAAKAKAIVRQEVSKGCLPDILAQPVALEPAYHPVLGGEDHLQRDRAVCCVYENPPPEDELVRLQIWISPDQPCDWVRSELLLKQLPHAHRRIALEIVGNKDRIGIQILCHQADQPIVRASFLGQFEQCMLTFTHADLLRQLPLSAWEGALFRDFFAPVVASHSLSRPQLTGSAD